MTNEQKKAYIAALILEREGAVRYGREQDVEAIDAELARVGHDPKPPAKRATKMTAKKGQEH